jgi:hypothetical protein
LSSLLLVLLLMLSWSWRCRDTVWRRLIVGLLGGGHIAEDGPALGELDWPNALEGATGKLAVEQARIDEVGDIDPEGFAKVERDRFGVDDLEAPGS